MSDPAAVARPRWRGWRAGIALLAGLWVGTAPAATAPVQPLNDTGIGGCANGTTNNLACPVADYPGQDAQFGRDVTHNDDSDGHVGFAFTKLDANGGDMAASASAWSCVRDNVTGLIWEVKTDDGGPRDWYWTYSWYNPDPATNGGSAGYADYGNNCYNPARCDTAKFVADVNQAGLCGASDWRLPTREELRSLVDYGRYNPTIDMAWFPNTLSTWYWSSSPLSGYTGEAWFVDFGLGYGSFDYTDGAKPARLVRGGQALPFVPYLMLAKAGTGSGAVGGGGFYSAGNTVTLSATPDVGNSFAGWGPSPCAPSFTMPTTDLTCTATFSLIRYPVSTWAGAHGSISPAVRQVLYGATARFTVTPETGYSASVTGCGGSLSGNTYTTGLITAACAVRATFVPQVTVAATDNVATEKGLTTGTFTFYRGGATTGSLTVSYQVTGTATAGKDYKALGTRITFPVGKSQVTKTLVPLQDTLVEAAETIILTLQPSPLYAVGKPASAKIILRSDD